jgi:acyl-[acyl-carrier-protein] desaturase
MSDPTSLMTPEMERSFTRLFRDFFDLAERRRRWNIQDDVPWNECNKNLNPAVADVVESFCAVELYLPDYTSKIIPLVRRSKGRAWFYANWGYEEAKHSMVLNEWLLRSGHRTEEQMTDMEGKVFEKEWNLPHDTALGMLTYTMVQEHATWLNYRNLRQRVLAGGGDPALEKILMLLQVDEKSHHQFFTDCFELFLKHDRDLAIESLRRVLNHFEMPAITDLLPDSKRRVEQVLDLQLYNERIFFGEVYLYMLQKLGVSKAEMRGRRIPKSVVEP